MDKTKLGLVFGLSATIGLLAGCGGDSATETQAPLNQNASTMTLQGDVFKGPIDKAIIQVTDMAGSVLASSNPSQQGSFNIADVPINDQSIVFIKSIGGSYKDEATGQIVRLDELNTGLMSVLNQSELQSLAQSGQPIVLTPETTLVAKIVEQQLADGMSQSGIIGKAEGLVNSQLINDTSPIPGANSDSIMRIGDAVTPTPTSQGQALARNRAVSYSYETKNLGLAPDQVFTLIDNRATDLLDGVLDGQAGNSPIIMVGMGGNTIPLDGQKNTSSMARAEVLNGITDRYVKGQNTPAEATELAAVGMDMTLLDQAKAQNRQAQGNTADNLLATNLPAFVKLQVLQDEDGNLTDTSATYTLTPTENVDVTINSPQGSWTTPMLRYNGMQHAPVIVARRGYQMNLTLNNQLSEESTIHWHGFKIPGSEDGGPDLPIPIKPDPDSVRTYSFTMSQPAASLWFHPHADGLTATQVYHGLAGGYVLKDDITDTLEANNELPSGNYDIPMMIQDRNFGPDPDPNDGIDTRPLVYDNAMAMGASGMMGNTILVNDVELPKLDVETRQYRLRLFNGSNGRTYNFALSDDSNFFVVATDGGLLPSPVETKVVVLGAGERAEIVVDFGAYAVGDKVMLVSKPFTGSQMAMMNSGGSNPNPVMGMGTRMADTGGTPPVGTPPVGTPPVGTPPVGTPPVGTPPVGTPPVGTPPVGTPPVGTPPVGTSPGGTSPGGGMPGGGTPGAGTGGGGLTTGAMSAGNFNGAAFDIMRFDITTQVDVLESLYTTLPANAEINTRLNEVDATVTRDFIMSMAMGTGGTGAGAGTGGGMGGGGMKFVINGKSFDINRVDEIINVSGTNGVTEVWTISNTSMMAHPFHAHAIQWQILDRNNIAAAGVNLGWVDTVLVQPGETVRIIGQFDPTINSGKYMYHCHILEHEDNGMMGIFKVQ